MSIDQLDEAFTGQPVTAADVVAAVIVLFASFACAWLIGRMLRRYFGRPGRQSDQMAKLLGRVGQWGVAALGLGWALSIVGLDIGGVSFFILASLLIAGLAIRPIAESFAISVAIASRPAFGVGDEIGVEGVVGEVLEITERSVVVRRRDGARVHIPNADMISERVTVFSTDAERRSTIDVKLDYHTDIDTADHVIRAALSDVDGLIRIGSIRATSLNGCVQLSIRFWHESSIDAANQTADAVVRAVHTAFGKAGIEGAPSLQIALADPVLPDGTAFGATRPRASDHDAQ
jgi:small-conductance mechanosensitive channel